MTFYNNYVPNNVFSASYILRVSLFDYFMSLTFDTAVLLYNTRLGVWFLVVSCDLIGWEVV